MHLDLQNTKSPNKNDLEWWEPQEGSLQSSFCLESSLHGLKYIGQPKRHMIERIFWFIAFMTSVSLAVVTIVQLWEKNRKTPVITVFRPKETTINQIPFPAVTICNSNNVLKEKAEQFTLKALESDDSVEAYNELFMLDHVCEASTTFSERFNFSTERGSINTTVRDKVVAFRKKHASKLGQEKPYIALLNEVAQKCSELILLCMWNDEVRNCSDLFYATETDYGYCCTFNMVPTSLLLSLRNDSRDNADKVEEWRALDLDSDKLVQEEDDDDDDDLEQIPGQSFRSQTRPRYPRHQYRPGKSSGLSVLLDPDLDSYFCTNTDSVGFVALAHGTLDFPRVADNGLAIKPDSEVFLKISPEIIMADEDIRDFPLEKRKCYAGKEYSLKYYMYYSVSNCEDECMANLTFHECQCVRYYMPRSESQTICGPNEFQCAERVRKMIVQQGIQKRCKICLPTCTEIQYEMSTSFIPMRKDVPLWEYPNGTNASWVNKNVSILHVHFAIDSTYPKFRKELYGFLDLLSNTGGLLGLCLGFSALSLLEIFYFITLRACCQSKHGRKIGSRINQVSGSAWKKTYEAMVKGWNVKKTNVTLIPYAHDYHPRFNNYSFSPQKQLNQIRDGLPYYLEPNNDVKW